MTCSKTTKEKPKSGASCRLYWVEAGLYRDKKEADKACEQLKKLGFRAFVL